MAKKTPPITLSELKGNPRNPRYMKEENAAQLQQSIQKLGDLSCIVYNERFSRLVGGHQRKEIITRQIGENPEIIIDHVYDTPNEVQTTKEGHIVVGGERYKVRFVDFSEEDEALAVIVANDKRNQGSYDMELLPTMVDIADASPLSIDFALMDFIEGFNLDLGDTKKVEFDAKEKEDVLVSFKFSKEDGARFKSKLEEIKNGMDVETDEEAILKVVFSHH